MHEGRLPGPDHNHERNDEAMSDGPAPPPALTGRVTPASEARFAWPLTGSWWLISGTPW
jgi:hypothetical protein